MRRFQWNFWRGLQSKESQWLVALFLGMACVITSWFVAGSLNMGWYIRRSCGRRLCACFEVFHFEKHTTPNRDEFGLVKVYLESFN